MAKEKSCKVCTGVALACCLVGCLVCIVIGIVVHLKMSDILTEQINQVCYNYYYFELLQEKSFLCIIATLHHVS